MKDKLVTPYIGKALVAGPGVHHSGADSLSVLSILTDTLVMLCLLSCLCSVPKQGC